jgi:hypothetical protein
VPRLPWQLPPIPGWARLLGGVAYLVIFVVVAARDGIPVERAQVLAWLMGGLIIATAGLPGGGLVAVLRDWVPLGLVLAAYDMTRGVADTLGMPIQEASLVRIERFLFAGHVPTAAAQARVGFEGPVRWWEWASTILYLSHFVVSFVLLAVLWWLSRRQFRAFRRRFLTLTGLGLATYVLVPAAPPWMASRDGLIGPVQRLVVRALQAPGFRLSNALVQYGARYGNDVAALPSLHAGWSALVALFLCRFVPRWARPLLLLYPVALGAALVVCGEHYVFDVLLGFLYAGAVMAGWSYAERRCERRRRRGAAGADAARGAAGADVAAGAGTADGAARLIDVGPPAATALRPSSRAGGDAPAPGAIRS